MTEKYEEWIRCADCRKEFLLTEEMASYKCPHCKSTKPISETKKPLDAALEKLKPKDKK